MELLNCGLSIWQKPKDFFSQMLSFLWKGPNKRLRDQTIDKTVTIYRTERGEVRYLKLASVRSTCICCSFTKSWNDLKFPASIWPKRGWPLWYSLFRLHNPEIITSIMLYVTMVAGGYPICICICIVTYNHKHSSSSGISMSVSSRPGIVFYNIDTNTSSILFKVEAINGYIFIWHPEALNKHAVSRTLDLRKIDKWIKIWKKYTKYYLITLIVNDSSI